MRARTERTRSIRKRGKLQTIKIVQRDAQPGALAEDVDLIRGSRAFARRSGVACAFFDLWALLRAALRYGRGAWRFHRTLRRRGRSRFLRDLGFHARFLRRAGSPLSTRNGHSTFTVAALLVVWQIANLAGFAFEAIAQRLPSEGPAAKIT